MRTGRQPSTWPNVRREARPRRCATPRGTTGNPKGVLYSHRSTVLHTFAIALPDALNVLVARHHPAGRADVPRQRLGPAVRGLHDGLEAGVPGARGWTASRCYELFETEKRDDVGRRAHGMAGAARPTSKRTGLKFTTMRRTVIGGSACPPAMMKAFQEGYDVQRDPCLGHDRDEPGGHRGNPEGQAPGRCRQEQIAWRCKARKAVRSTAWT